MYVLLPYKKDSMTYQINISKTHTLCQTLSITIDCKKKHDLGKIVSKSRDGLKCEMLLYNRDWKLFMPTGSEAFYFK